jgi:hypothetical protein
MIRVLFCVLRCAVCHGVLCATGFCVLQLAVCYGVLCAMVCCVLWRAVCYGVLCAMACGVLRCAVCYGVLKEAGVGRNVWLPYRTPTCSSEDIIGGGCFPVEPC